MATSFYHPIKSEIKKNLSLSIPLILSQVIYASSGFLGTAMVAQLGEAALAASILVSMIWISLSVLFFGLLNSVSVLIAHEFGAKNYKEISKTIGQSYLLGFGISFLIIIIMLCVPWFFQFTKQPITVLKLCIEYTHSLIWTIPGLIFLIISEQFLAGIGKARIVMRISFMVVPIEIPLIYILIFGKLGLPAFGIAGVGYGFAVTYTITAICLFFYLYYSKSFQVYHIFSRILTVNMSKLKELVRIGLPMGLMHVIEVGTFMVATFWIAQFGTTILAAHQIVMQYLGFVITLVFAMSQAVTIRVGHSVGENNTSDIELQVYVGILLNFFFVLVIALVLYFFPAFFISLDVNIHDQKNIMLVQKASILFQIVSVLLIFDNMRIIFFGALRGLKDTKFSMYASFFNFVLVGLPAAYFFGFNLHFQGEGVWWGLTLGIVCSATMLFIRLKYLLIRMKS